MFAIVRYYLFLILVFLFINLSWAQDINKVSRRNFEKALDHYNADNYERALKKAFKATKRSPQFIQPYLLIADIFHYQKKFKQEKEILSKALTYASGKEFNRINLVLGNLYFNAESFDSAAVFYSNIKNKDFKNSFIENRLKLIQLAKDNSKYCSLIRIDQQINSEVDEYWPMISADDSILFFTRKEMKGRFWVERAYSSVWQDSSWSEASMIFPDENNEVSKGAITFSSDGKLMFLTACGLPQGMGSCDIYISVLHDGRWTEPQNIGKPVNTTGWESQPSVSADNKYLFFTSNRSGGYGSNDIWFSEMVFQHGSIFPRFLPPENLGSIINSTANDFAPFLHADGKTLFLSSDRNSGYGGEDIYVSKKKELKWGEPENIGFPLNSVYNDFGLVVSPTTQKMVFASNRSQSGNNNLDLFQFQLPDEIRPDPAFFVSGSVYNAVSNKKLNAFIMVNMLKNDYSYTIKSDAKKGYNTNLIPGVNYSFNVSMPGYMFFSDQFHLPDTIELDDQYVKNIFLEPIAENKNVVLKNVFFKFDSDSIQKTSFPELDRIIEFLNLNPTLKIEISGHTDNVGSEDYNQNLSRRRARAIYEYLEKHIDKVRLSYKGYGSKHPVASNSTEEGRAKNRRSELKIIAL